MSSACFFVMACASASCSNRVFNVMVSAFLKATKAFAAFFGAATGAAFWASFRATIAAGLFAAVIAGIADFLAAALGATDGFALVAGFDAMVRLGLCLLDFPDRITPHAGKQALQGRGGDWPESLRVGGISCSSGVRARDVWSEVTLRHLWRLGVVAIGGWTLVLQVLHAWAT
jgi:hypothetical protein